MSCSANKREAGENTRELAAFLSSLPIAVTCQETAWNRPGEMAGLRTEVSTPLGPDSMSLPLLPWKGRVGAGSKARPPETPLLSWGELVASELVELKGCPG